MADFDKNLQPIIKETGYKPTDIKIGPAKAPGMAFPSSGGGVSDLSREEDVFAKLKAASAPSTPKALFVSNAELEANKRYKFFNPTIGDYEDFAAQGQEWYKQATNGVLKGANLAATTIAGGFGTLYGIGKAVLPGGKFSDIFQNEIMTNLDKWNTYVDNEVLPNYYTAAERNSEWYARDNWLTWNFLFDKLIKNSGFAVGAMVGGNIANAGLLKLGSKLGGALAKGATAAEASQAFKLFTPLLRNTSRAFSAGKNAEVAALLESKISSIADLSSKASQIANISKQTGQFARFSDSARRTAVAAYSSAGEASFEALHTAKEYRENLIEEYKREKGFDPTGEELTKIDREAAQVGKTAFFGNMALLSITEFNQLPYLIGSSYGPSRQAINSLLGSVDNVAIDASLKGIKAVPKTRFGKLYQGTRRAGVYVFDPKESMQEVLQYGLQVGTQNYFKKSREAGEADLYVDGFLYGLFGEDEYGEGVGALVSKEGIEGGILGGITGAAMQARGKYQERKALAKNTKNFLNMLENAPTFKEAFQEKLDAANRGIVLQQQERDAILNGDKLEATDLRVDGMHDYLAPRIKYGRFDMVIEDLNELKQSGMTESGLAELKEQGMANINDDINSFQKRITSIENAANNLNDMYQSLNIRYAGETIKVDGEERRKYSPITIDKLAYAASKIANYDVRIPQLNGNLVSAGINTQAILNDVIGIGIPNAEATKEALDTINSMNVTSDVKDDLKGQLDDVIELSLRRKMFIEEYDSIKNNPLNYERPEEEVDEVDVLQKEGRKKIQKTLEVGKEYSLTDPISLEKGKLVLAPKFTVLSSTLGGEFEVLLPDGTTTFFSPEQFDKYNLSEETNTSQEMEDALNQAIDDVLNYPAFKNVVEKPEEGVNKLEYTNSLQNKKLTTAVLNRFKKLTAEIIERENKKKEVKEELKKNSKDLNDQQLEDLDDTDVITPTISDSAGERVDTGETGALKKANEFFDSSTTESEEYSDPAKSAPHVVRSRIFLNNARRWRKRNKLRAIVFTYSQEASLGLSGITALSYGKKEDQLTEEEKSNPDNGFVGMVFVELDGAKRYYVDQNGERIGEVGQPTDLSRVIFQTMPTTSIEYSRGNDKYRDKEKEEFIGYSKIWKNRRTVLMKDSTVPPMTEFKISKGFPVTTQKDKVYVKSAVGNSLVGEEQIVSVPGLINVVTTDTIAHQGEIIKSEKGLVYIQDGEMIQYLNNNKLGNNKSSTIYYLIKSIIEKMENDASKGVRPEFNKNMKLFLSNILNYKKPLSGVPMKSNQIWFDVDNLSVKIGGKSYEFSEISQYEKEIIDNLAEAYHSANAKTLRKGEVFYEYFMENGTLKEKKWTNYQEYLLSGKNRSVDQIPFVTIATPTTAQPYPFQGKYATLVGFELAGEGYVSPVSSEEDKKEPPTAPKKPADPSTVIEPVMVGSFTLNNGAVNSTKVLNIDVQFKSDITPAGELTNTSLVLDDNMKKLIQDWASNSGKMTIVRKAYASATEGKTDEEAVQIFFIGQIQSQIRKTIAERDAAAPTVPVSDIDAKKADIERRLGIKLPVKNTSLPVSSKTWGDRKSLANQLSSELKGVVERGVSMQEWLDKGYGRQLATWTDETIIEFLEVADIERRRQETLRESALSEGEIELLKKGASKSQIANYQSDNYMAVDPDGAIKEFNSINSEHDAELAALEGKPAEEKKPEPPADPKLPADEKKASKGILGRLKSGVKDDEDTRKLRKGESGGRIDDRDIQAFKAWHQANVPNIPFEILDSIITLHDGTKAWGVFENGVAKFFKRGLRGTEYHEVFEGIWKAFITEAERNAILEEFREKKETFFDRESGKYIPYNEATDRQAKERIADDFADYRIGKLPARNLSERIRRFFKAIVDFFKSFVVKPSLKEDLFKSIDSGKFKDSVLPEVVKSALPEYRKLSTVDGTMLSEDVAHAIVQDMTLTIAQYIFNRNNTDGLKSLYSPQKSSGKEIYNILRTAYQENIDVLGEETFDELFLRSKSLIGTMGVNLDVEGIVSLNDPEKSDKLYAAEAFDVDFMKNMRFAVKFALATNPAAEVKYDYENGQRPQLLENEGLKVMGNFNKLFANLINKLSGTSVRKIDEKLIELMREDGNYYRIFARLKGDPKTGIINFNTFSRDDWRFYIQFVQSFVKNNPFIEIATVRKNEKGEIESFASPGDRLSIVRKLKSDWFENVKELAKSSTSFVAIKKIKNTRMYVIDNEQEYYPSAKGLLEPERAQNYLKNIGIEIPLDIIKEIKKDERYSARFDSALQKIYEFGPTQGLAGLSGGKFGGVDSHVGSIADIYSRVASPDQETTRLNVNNKRTSNFTDSNAVSVFESEFNEAQTLEDLLDVRPELLDTFSVNSIILKPGGLFFDEDGKKRPGKTINIGVIDGLQDQLNDRGVSVSDFAIGERFTVELNENINGNYYIMIPADSSTERMLRLGTPINYDLFNDDSSRAYTEIYSIFKGYLEDEINLILAEDVRRKLKNVGNRATTLRFFKDIIDPQMVAEIHEILAKNVPVAEKETEVKKYINDNIELFNSSIRATVEGLNQSTLQNLIDSGEVKYYPSSKEGYVYSYQTLDSNLAQDKKLDVNSLSESEISQVLSFANVNYMIANMEMHKVIFGDPYQFAEKNGKLEETKRIKSWLSPRRITIDSEQLNKALTSGVGVNYNYVNDELELSASDMFYYKFKSYVKTVTVSDVRPVSQYIEGFEDYKESDGFSIIIDGAYREVKLKNAEWFDDTSEKWFQWNQAYARQKLAAKGIYKYENSALEKHDAALIKKPQPQFKTEVLKPIVSGSKYDVNRIEGLIDKFSQMPITYKMVEGTAMENLYIKMLEEKIGYVVYESGRKEGVRNTHSLYNSNGEFNNGPITENSIENVAWKTYGIQVENSYEEGKLQTRGSQLTKNDSIDMFENGAEAEGMEGASKLSEQKIEIFKQMHTAAYEDFLKKLGMRDLGGKFEIANNKKISKELQRELLRRQVSQNMIETIRLDEKGEFMIPFEASHAYEQIRSVLISMVNKSLLAPSLNGKPHVQVPATLWENISEGRKLIRKVGDKWVRITRKQYDALSEEDKKSVRLSSDKLKFYRDKDGGRHMEIMIPNYWKKYFKDKKKFPDEESIIKYLNQKENYKILFGVGFRIPHQAMSSTEVFRVVGFLDDSMGSTVVVPSEIVEKAGSDFDIDKLNMYLKNVFMNELGYPELVQYKGSKDATITHYESIYDKTLALEMERMVKYQDFRRKLVRVFDLLDGIPENEYDSEHISNALGDELFDFFEFHETLIERIEKQAVKQDVSPSEYINGQIETMSAKYDQNEMDRFNADLRKEFAEDLYRESLENEYFEILQNLITLPGNFKRLMSPVSDAGLPKVADELDAATNNKESDIKNKLISRSFMTSLRHAFLIGKKWVGIAAVNITGHSIAQKVGLYFDSNLMNNLSDYDRGFLEDVDGNLTLSIPHNKVMVNGKEMISLAGRKTVDGSDQFISDRLSGYSTSFVDVANDPFILKIVKSDVVVGTVLLMERLGMGELSPFFLNQPIINEYLKYLSRQKSRSLFGKDNLDYIYDLFKRGKEQPYDLSQKFVKNPDGSINFAKSKQNLLDSITEYANRDMSQPTSEAFNAEQVAVFKEFLKLAKLAQMNFKFTQAYNYDTTRVRNADGFKRKMNRTALVREKSIISSIDKVFDQTFIGDQMKFVLKELKALGEIMKLDSAEIEQYTDNVIETFYLDEFMSSDDFDYVAKKLKTSFLDYIMQTKSDLNIENYKDLFYGKNSVASRLIALKKSDKYKGRELLQNLTPYSSLNEDGPVTVKLKTRPQEAIDIDRHVGMMRELKEDEPEFYEDLIKLSILQGSGETMSSISLIIPIEDRAKYISEVIKTLQPSEELENYAREGMFYRNNFRDERIVPTISPRGYQLIPNTLSIDYTYVTPFAKLKRYGITQGSGKIIMLNNKYSFLNEADRDFVKMRRYQFVSGETQGGVIVDITTGVAMSMDRYNKLSNDGQLSKSEMVGYKKVKYPDGTPYVLEKIIKNTPEEFSVFKMVNLYGDSRIVSEYPKVQGPSKFDNNTFKIKEEMTDSLVVSMMNNEDVEVAASKSVIASEKVHQPEVSKTPEQTTSVEIAKSNYTRQEVQTNLNTAYVFTENTHSITAFPNRSGGGSAVIRPEPNAFAIVTKKKYDYNTRENVDYSDTEADFKEFTEVNTRLINELKNSGKSKIVFPQGFATDKAMMPTRFAEWLQKALLDNFGLVTELNSSKTGLISKSVQQVVPETPTENTIAKTYRVGEYTIYEFEDGTFDVNAPEEGIILERGSSYEQATKAIESHLAETNGKDVNTAEYKYFGRFYTIVLDENNVGIDVIGYKGKKAAKSKLLDEFNANPNIDPQNEKPFKEEEIIESVEQKEEGNTFTFSDGTKINTGKIKLNSQQEEALQKAVNAITSRQTKFVLRGYAGTGKSTISKFIREYFQQKGSSKSIVYSSPTHKANTNLLVQLIRGGIFGVRPLTTASLLNKTKVDGEFIAGPRNAMPYSGVLIVDEGSMVDNGDYEMLMSLAKDKNTTIVFMGDPAQLPPVGSPTLSKALQFESLEEGIELTQVMRQAGDNPLLDILTNIRQNLKTVVEKFSFSTKINGKNEGVAFSRNYSEFNDVLLKHFTSNEYKEDPTYAKIVTYTNSSVANYNTMIQSQLGLDDYAPGSILMGYEQTGTSPTIHNGQDYIVLSSEYVRDVPVTVFQGNVDNKRFDVSGNVSGWKVKVRRVFSKEDEALLKKHGETALLYPQEVTIINPSDDRNIEFMKNVMSLKRVADDKKIAWYKREDAVRHLENFFSRYQLPADMIEYKGRITTLPKLKQEDPELFRVNRETGKSKFDELARSDKPMLAKNIDYGYAVTSHKAQGSTYKYVFVDYENMDNPANNRNITDGGQVYANERQQLRYVGLSRTSNVVYVFTRKSTNDSVSEPSSYQRSVESPVTNIDEPVNSEGNYPKIRSFYESLTPDQKLKMGSLESLINEYINIPFDMIEEDFVDSKNCSL